MKIGLVLSGGAVRGIAHIGILKALEEEKLSIYAVSGVSAGAIIGAFYCYGYSAKEMEDIARNINPLQFFSPSKSFKSLFSLKNLDKFLNKYIKESELKNLKKKFIVTTTNLNRGNYQFWDEGNLFILVRASSSLPFLFEPVLIDDDLHVDGGLMNNLPIEPLIKECDYIIAVEVNPLSKYEGLNNIFSISVRSFYLAVRANIEVRKNMANLFVQPKELSSIGLFDFRKIDEAINIGYKEGKRIVEAIKPLL